VNETGEFGSQIDKVVYWLYDLAVEAIKVMEGKK
jgi:hypothetical protein